MDIASCAAGPQPPSSIAWSRSERANTTFTIMPRVRHHRVGLAAALVAAAPFFLRARQPPATTNDAVTVLRPARVFDGDAMHPGWVVRVKGERIDAVGPESSVAASGAKAVDLPETPLLPRRGAGPSRGRRHAD